MAKFKDQDSELTAFERFEQELKSIIFGVLYVMLKDEEDSLLAQIFLNVADGFQTLGLVFNNSIPFPWKNQPFVDDFIFGLTVLQIAYWCMMLTWYSYLAIFYFFILLICLVVLDIVYIGYSFSVKRFTIMWPLYVLRSTCSLFVTVLFMPLIDLFTSMVQCEEDDSGVQVHYAFPEIVCWQGMHILHGTIALIVTTIFVIICCMVSLTFFESKNDPNDPSAKINARNEVVQNVYKIICVVLTTFFIQDEYQWMLAIAMTVGALIIFEKGFYERPYYNETMNIVLDIINGIFLWSCATLCLAMLLSDTDFSGSVQLFFLGSPIVGFILATWKDRRQKLLMKPIEQFENGDEWYQKVRYYMSLIHYKDTSRAAAIELKGFIYDHEETCDKRDCPLKLYKQNISGMVKDKKRKAGRNLGAENNNLLWGYASKLFQVGLSKFPNATLMRIAYALFLKEKLGNKNMAVNELFHAEKSSPPFDEQFVIYRYRKIMEEETSEVQGEGNAGGGAQSANLDVVSIIAYDNHMRQCKEQIDRAAYLHMEFWSELQQRRPDLSKLSKTGSKINTTIADVEDHWTKLQKINPNNPKALRMYGDFLIEILNDKEAGQELISRAKDNVASRTAVVPDFYNSANSGSNAADLWLTTSGSDGSPCVLAAGEQNKLGEMMQLNMGMCRTFGYTKNEMLGKKVDVLMPQVYSKCHDSLVKSSLLRAEEGAQGDEKQGDHNTGGRFILGRHKSGYLVPLWLETRIFFLVSQGSLLGGMFKQEKKNQSVCYLLLDGNMEVVGVSSLCVVVLKITNSVIRNFRIPIGILAPGLFDKEQNPQYRSKEGGILEFHLPEIERREERKTQDTPTPRSSPKDDRTSFTPAVRGTEKEKDKDKEKEEEEKEEAEPEEVVKPKVKASTKHMVKMNCHLTDIVFTGETKPAGYIVRLEPAEDRKVELEGFKIAEYPKFPDFQIVFDPINYRFMCAWSKEDAQKEKELLLLRYKSLAALWKQPSNLKPTDDIRDQPDKEQPEITTQEEEEALRLRNRQTTMDLTKKERRNYGEGIKTKRLQNGVFVEINEINRMIEREMEEQQRLEEEKRRGNEKDLMSADAVRESLKSRKGLIAVIKDRSDPPAIFKVRIVGYIVALLFLTMAAIDFGVTTTKMGDVNDNVSLVRYSYRRVTLLTKISYYITKAILANPNYSGNLMDPGSYSAFIGDCKHIMTDSLAELYLAQNNITLSKISMRKEQDRLLNSKVVALEFKDTSTDSSTGKKSSYYTLTEAVLQMTSSIFTVINLADSSYLLTNDDVEFVLYNVLNDVYDKLMESSNYYVLDLQRQTKTKHIMILVLFIVAVLLLFISALVLFPLVSNVGKIRAQVLSLFLHIPLTDVKGLSKRCERFLASNNEEHNADMIDSSESQGKDNLLEEEETEGSTPGSSTQGAPKAERTSRRRRFINDKSSNMSFFVRYAVAMVIIAAFYVTNYAMTRVYLAKIDKFSTEINSTIVAQPQDATVLMILESLIGFGSILPLDEASTFKLLTDVEIDQMQMVNHNVQYHHLFNKDKYPSSYVDAYDMIMISDLCDSSDTLGFTFDCEQYIAGIAQEGLQTVMVQYVESVREMLRLYLTINATATSGNRSDFATLLKNSEEMYMEEAETVVHNIMEGTMSYLLDSLISALKSMLNYEITRRVIMFIVLLLFVIVIFTLVWMPFIGNLSTEIWRTKCMLTIIPKEVIAQMKSVQKFLNDPNIFSAKGEA